MNTPDIPAISAMSIHHISAFWKKLYWSISNILFLLYIIFIHEYDFHADGAHMGEHILRIFLVLLSFY